MSDHAITVRNIGKRYLIRPGSRSADTLGETISNTVARVRSHAVRLLTRGSQSFRPKKEEFWALRDVSFDVPQGQVLGIIGRNGSGKSTLLKVLSRITPPSEGKATMAGRVGSLLEIGTGFHGDLTGRENIFLSGAILGMNNREIARSFDEIIDFSGVEKFIDTPVKHFSSGMYLRLAFAVAAHLKTEILLVDEVLAVGDATFQKKCISKMMNLAHEGRTVLFVSHNLPAVSKLCEKGIVLDEGRVAAMGDVDEAVAAYSNLLNAKNDDAETEAEEGISISGLRFGGDGYRQDSAQPFQFGLTMVVRKRYWDILLHVVLQTHDGMLAVVELTDGEQYPRFLEPGRYRVDLTLPPLWLRPQGYLFSVKVIAHPDVGRLERYVSDWKDVVVTSEDKIDSSRERWLTPPAQWDVQPLEHTD